MASNQRWNEECVQPCKRGGGMHQLKEVDMVSAKLDLIMKKLEARDMMKKEVMDISDSCIVKNVEMLGTQESTVKNFKRM
jgi:hypothetical protein